MMNRFIATAGIAAALTVLAGCSGSGLDKVVVHGEVSYNGEPIPNGQIRFTPVDGTKGPVSGGVIKDGLYVAEGMGGVPVGSHRVEIRAYRPAKNAVGAMTAEGGASEQYVPGKYNGESILTATVSADNESAPINFALEGPK
jgi:hypothetical protein